MDLTLLKYVPACAGASPPIQFSPTSRRDQPEIHSGEITPISLKSIGVASIFDILRVFCWLFKALFMVLQKGKKKSTATINPWSSDEEF